MPLDESPAMRSGEPASAMAHGSAPGGERGTFVAFGLADFRFLFASGVASGFGMQMMMISRGVLAWDLTASFAITGVLSLSFGIPMLLLALVGGAVADRVDRRLLSLATQFGNTAIALLTAVLITTGLITVPLLFAIGLVQGAMFAFMMPSRQALLADVVPRSQLMNAIALNTAVMAASTIAGPALAGALIALGGTALAFYAQAVLGAAGFLTLIPISRRPITAAAIAARRNVFREISGGLRYLVGTRPLLIMLIMALVPAIFGMPYQVLLPGFATENLGNQSLFATMLTVSGVGSLMGSFLLATLTQVRRKAALQLAFGVGVGAGLLSLGVGSRMAGAPAALAASFVIGFSMMTYQTLNNTMLMSAADPRYMGRVMSIVMLSFSAGPLMGWPMGVIADRVGADSVFIGLGFAVIGFLALMAITQPSHMFGGAPERSVAADSPPLVAEDDGPPAAAGSAGGRAVGEPEAASTSRG
ncbi:MAG: MFS transporter [Chloroflexi bacterium]|nr:MFS transporter [Chloroflexota bacterium]